MSINMYETVYVRTNDEDGIITDMIRTECGALLYEISVEIPGCGWVPLEDWYFADELIPYSAAARREERQARDKEQDDDEGYSPIASDEEAREMEDDRDEWTDGSAVLWSF